jgi:hypothetical protein
MSTVFDPGSSAGAEKDNQLRILERNLGTYRVKVSDDK